ncbi:MAG: hypothetical protein GXP55_08680 [Deltaproteobacteria bacterium]|nr:hypothetical protein [Deltaproteobacteria bacterium]
MSKLVFCGVFALATAAHVCALAQETGSASTSLASDLSAPRAGGEDVSRGSELTSSDDPAEFIDFSIRPKILGPRPHPVTGVLAEFGLALVGVGAGTGITIGLVVIAVEFGSWPGFIITSALGALITFGLANAAITGAGLATGGRGSARWTTLGMFLGAGAGALAGYGLIRAAERSGRGASDGALMAGMALMPLFSIAGGILAFELSDRAARRRSAQAVSVVPVAGPIEGGLSLGLAGRF